MAQEYVKGKWKIGTDSARMLVLFFACVVSNLSQMPLFVELEVSSLISICAWLICATMVALPSRPALQRGSMYLIGLSLAFFGVLGIQMLMVSLDYWTSGNIYTLAISVFVFLLGGLYGRGIKQREWERLVWGYTLSSCVVAINVYLNFFAEGFDISNRIYVYESKNSLSQILLTSIVLLLFGLERRSRKKHWLPILIIVAGLIVLMGMMKSRASLLGFAALFLGYLVRRDVPKWVKWMLILGAVAAVAVVLFVPSVQKLIVQDILLANRAMDDLDDISSGRLLKIRRAIRLVRENLLFGVGDYYLDSYPVTTILQFGLIPGLIMWLIALLPMIHGMRRLRREDDVYQMDITLFVLAMVYAINGLFEAYAPLGPGVKCYFLWLLYGILLNGHPLSAARKRTRRIRHERRQH